MNDTLFDVCVVLLFLAGCLYWLVSRKTIKWLIRQWVYLHSGWGYMKRHKKHAPWLSLPFWVWFVTANIPWYSPLVRIGITATAFWLWRKWRKNQKTLTPKQRPITAIPEQEEPYVPRRRQTPQTDEQETGEREGDSWVWGEVVSEDMETPPPEERPRPKLLRAPHRFSRIWKDKLDEN
jgi:hypothetical protein